MLVRLNSIFTVDPTLDIVGFKQIKSHLHYIDWMSFKTPKNDSEVASLVFEYHERKREDILKITRKVEELWHKKEKKFVLLASEYFSTIDFPDHEYVCYPTIWPLIARDPQKHYVGFPVASNEADSCAVLAHEFLHELFFHHVYNTFENIVDLNSKIVYDLSEVFNVLVLREEVWQKEFPFDVQPYTEHIDLFNMLLPIWKKKGEHRRFY